MPDTVPQAFQQTPLKSKQQAKIHGILQKVRENPTWSAEQVISWATEAYQIQRTTAVQYLAEARKLFKHEQTESE